MAFKELYEKLEAYQLLMEGQEYIHRSFAGKIFFLFSTILVNAKFANYDPVIMDEVFRLQQYLFSIYIGKL